MRISDWSSDVCSSDLGTANSNQVLLEAMGVQLPGAPFVTPATPLRDALPRAATERALRITALGADYRPLGRLIDEHAIAPAITALMPTGCSTNPPLQARKSGAAGPRWTARVDPEARRFINAY